MVTPLLGQFLVALNGFVKVENASQIADYLVLEPPFAQHYNGMIDELRKNYPKGSEKQLEAKCENALPVAAANWTNFIRFMAHYLAYLRDISSDQSKYLETYEHLLELQNKANSALGQGSHGNLLLHTVITNARLLCRLAIGLDRQPELMSQLKIGVVKVNKAGSSNETLPERAANVVRAAFTICLNDRSELVDGRPGGRKPGIYVLANLCLKILFQCRKTRNATQIFENISNSAPPLAAYPKSQRVSYLYYLGRFMFQNNHFYRAQLVLQQAYNEAPASERCVKQRRLILVHLISSNIILGRFPSRALLARPEADGFLQVFAPLCDAIRQGSLPAFYQSVSANGIHADFLMRYRILFQLKNRCEVLVWRSLMRKVFQFYGTRPSPETRIAASLHLQYAVAAFLISAREDESYVDPDIIGAEEDLSHEYQSMDLLAIVSKLSSLIDQGLVSGYIAREQEKLAILGAAKFGGDPIKAGFPNVWGVIERKSSQDVPGWKQETRSTTSDAFAGAGPGSVVRLSNVRAVGMGQV